MTHYEQHKAAARAAHIITAQLLLGWTQAMREALGHGQRKRRDRHAYQAEQYRQKKEGRPDAKAENRLSLDA